jgi:hypothetical protein
VGRRVLRLTEGVATLSEFKKTRGKRCGRSGGLLAIFAEQVNEFGFVLGLAAGRRRSGQHARGLGLAHALAGVGLDGFCGGKTGWLAFRHGKNEYGIDWATAEVAESSPGSLRAAEKQMQVLRLVPGAPGLAQDDIRFFAARAGI